MHDCLDPRSRSCFKAKLIIWGVMLFVAWIAVMMIVDQVSPLLNKLRSVAL